MARPEVADALVRNVFPARDPAQQRDEFDIRHVFDEADVQLAVVEHRVGRDQATAADES